jgi:hypothetical protein
VKDGGRGYPECANCVNRRFDPFACQDCHDGDKFLPDDIETDDDDYES